MIARSRYALLALLAAVLAFAVVVLGGYVRLSNAGLGCPDWPGCYGQLGVPEAVGPGSGYERPLEAGKAWKEMIHRYFAGALGMVIAALGLLAWRRRHEPGQAVALPVGLVGLVVFQALLGMWTVTWLLKPLVVTAHLLGGMATLALLVWLALRQGGVPAPVEASGPWRKWALAALGVVVVQIALGGWTSANYAALACPDFPTCQGRWWPETDFGAAFTLWHGLGIDYEGGILDNAARMTVHLVHRIGAVVTLLTVGGLVVALLRRARSPRVRRAALGVGLLLLVQVGLGVGNVVLGLPLTVAVAHNAGAAGLLLSVVVLNHVLRPVAQPVPDNAPAPAAQTGLESA
ncbi:cytochrome B [Thiohalorhabdus denitrificans]|uniref:Cytochrome c oxidase assembly protein subunit 15 n=1 Tax=Thiohalorhabdus denitrificans TaxID=381306 RepID=A0A0P9GM50_9GAMM|nr:COX15/CtaA family protein [Thiohalorhabdus denitrificans]KPV41402.1 cytochrome B [Thiohalorhabdus denitrificans]SCY26131.1 cytochrome c oxidase assembly protein subunit 15 [Thiohalorhabdus denitrificans]